MTTPDPEEYVELVLSVVEEIPWGRVTSYGAIAGVVGGGPRQVGAVMSRHGGPVPWWRVVRADGSLPPSHEENARPHYLDEGTPLRPSGAVDMTAAFWEPEPPAPLAPVESDRSPQIGRKSVHRAVHKFGRLVENSRAPVDEAVEPEECLPNLLRGRFRQVIELLLHRHFGGGVEGPEQLILVRALRLSRRILPRVSRLRQPIRPYLAVAARLGACSTTWFTP